MGIRIDHVAGGVGAGMVVGYLLDPDRGHARRARLRDKTVRVARKLNGGAEGLAKDAANRGRGMVAGTRYRFAGNQVDDARVLHERVRAELGRHVRHPHAVRVEIDGDTATLTGDVLAEEVSRTLRALRRVPGVGGVEARWAVHEDATGVPALQGEGRHREPIPELLQESWSPTARMLMGSAALSGLVAARGLPAVVAAPLRGASAVLGVRALTNLPLRRITGIAAGRRAIDVEGAILVAAPVDQVWAQVSDYGTLFQLIMPDVREVSGDGGRMHWVVSGPGGVPVGFDTEETHREEGREIAWKTCDGQLVAHTGTLRLDPHDDRTRLQIRLSYNPIAGAVGHAAAALLRADPKHKLRADLQRLKVFLETPAGKDSPHAERT